MGVMRKVDRPVTFPGRTLFGRTSGPVVYMGDVIPASNGLQGVSVYADERETRELLRAWGWPQPEEAEELRGKLARLEEEMVKLLDEVERLRVEARRMRVIPVEEIVPYVRRRPPGPGRGRRKSEEVVDVDQG